MKKKCIDLHIHSNYSDSSYSPENILDIALEKGLAVISITDHNVLDGSRALLSLCQNKNIRCISGIELDTLHNGINYHILGYGVNLSDPTFIKFSKDNNAMLEDVNIQLVKKLEKEYDCISLTEYINYQFTKEKGGWKLLYYLVSKGLSKDLTDGFKYYALYNHSYNCVNFPKISTTCSLIHQAGGKAILAHPGRVIKYGNIQEFEEEVYSLLPFGLDGIECYYPSHSTEITNKCLDICRKNNLLITAGSDCHGIFEATQIGEMEISLEQLNLGDLI